VNANTESVAASSSITQAGIFLGAGIGPVLLGLAIDATSFHASWLIVAVALLTAATIVTVVGFRTQRQQPMVVTEEDR
jgi:cyanate permease